MMKGMMQKGGSGSYEEDAPKTSFKQAFASARKGGEKTFEWNGKKYTTDVAKPAAAKAAGPRATASTPKTGEQMMADEGKRRAGLSSVESVLERNKAAQDSKRTSFRMPSGKPDMAPAKEEAEESPIHYGAKKVPTRGELREGASRSAMDKMPPKAFAKGGSVSGRADGIAKKGKTNCKMV